MTSTEDFLNQSSGESYDPFKFNEIGDTAAGTIMTEPRPIERPSLKDGTPEKQLPVNIETEAGPRTLWVRQGFLAGAIAEAVKEAGATTLMVGGKLAVRFTELRDTGKPNKAKIFKARYEPPASSGASMDDIFGD